MFCSKSFCFFNPQEEKAELKSHNYLLEKEKKALELRLSDKETQAQAYRLQIEHLTTEVQELQQQLNRHTDPRNTPPTVSVCWPANFLSVAKILQNNLLILNQTIII